MPEKYEPVIGESKACKSMAVILQSGATVIVHKFIDEPPKGFGRYKVQLMSNGTGLDGSDTLLEFGMSEGAYDALIEIHESFNQEEV
jgi:hypothetical protein